MSPKYYLPNITLLASTLVLMESRSSPMKQLTCPLRGRWCCDLYMHV